MPAAISLAGLLISTERLLFFVAIVIAFALARWLTRHRPEDRSHVEIMGEYLILAMIVTARIGFVALNWGAYRENPWKVLLLWQSGYDVRFGAIGALLFFVVYLLRSVDRQRLRLLAGAFLLPMLAFFTFSMAFPYLQRSGTLGYGDRMPALTMRTLSDKRETIQQYAGQPLVVNIWATWCLPCREEIPLLNHAARRYASEPIKIIGVNLAESPTTVKRFVHSVPIHYSVWVDPPSLKDGKSPSMALFKESGQLAVPTTLFVGCDGIIRHISVGELSPGTLYHQITKIRC